MLTRTLQAVCLTIWIAACGDTQQSRDPTPVGDSDPFHGDPGPGDDAGDPMGGGDPGSFSCAEVETLVVPSGVETYHLVLAAEGYRESVPSDRELFCADAAQMAAAIVAQEPFASAGLRITAVWVGSQDAGIQDSYVWENDQWVPQPSGKSTAFASALYVGHYVIEINDFLPLLDVRASAGGDVDNIAVLINSDEYGGTGLFFDFLPSYAYYAHLGTTEEITWADAQAWFQFSVTVGSSLLGSSLGEDVMIHELGHSVANLGDEYFDATAVYPTDDALLDSYVDAKANVSRTDDPVTIKWHDLLGVDGVGIFEGADGYGIGLYRPWDEDCIMRNDLKPHFCPVCARALTSVLTP